MIQEIAERKCWETRHESGLLIRDWLTEEQALEKAVAMRRKMLALEKEIARFEEWLLAEWGER